MPSPSLPALLLSLILCAAPTAGAQPAAPWLPARQESFTGPDWSANWTLKGAGPLDQAALLGAGKELTARLNPGFTAPALRVEYDAVMLAEGPDGAVSDLSCYIGSVLFRFGGENNTLSDIRAAGHFFPAPKPVTFEMNKLHRVAAEVNGRRCLLTVDGLPAGEMLLDAPLTEAAVTLYTWTGKSRFANLRVYTKPEADAVPQELLNRAAAARDAAEEAARPAVNAMTPGELRFAPTIHSVGIEWDILNDANHNAACSMRYRVKGAQEWRDTIGLLRIDYRGWYGREPGKLPDLQACRPFNMFAGSLMFLEPATDYDIELLLKDPDGGEATRLLSVVTRPLPRLAPPLRTLHVRPGDGGGAGTKEDPFRGIEAADKAARPGDLFLLASGQYKGHTLAASGSDAAYVAWRAAPGAAPLLTSCLAVAANHLWIEGLTFRPADEKDFGGIRGKQHPWHNLVALRNTFLNCRYAFSNTDRSWNGDPAALNRRWYLADNVMAGGPWTEYFTRLYLLADSDVCYNRISKDPANDKGGDAVSLRFSMNVDVYGNDIHDIDDDLFEPDSSYANIRIWRNRGISPKYQAVSLQPMLCSPWYIIRNEFLLTHPKRVATPFKCNVFDRAVLVNNTFFVRGRYGQYRADFLLKCFSRNNLWVHLYDNPSQATNPGGALWSGEGAGMKDQRYTLAGQSRPDWRTDIDYDGFAWQKLPDTARPFWWTGLGQFTTLESFAKALGVEPHAVALDPDALFDLPDVLAYAAEYWSPKRLTLRPDSRAVDAGAPVPNLCVDFTGPAPDLGAHELGAPPAHYGPRPRE
jgi:hypothetical protein